MKDRVEVLYLLRGLPGFGHVTPALAISKELAEKQISQVFLTYSNGIDKLTPIVERVNLYDIKQPEKTKNRVPWKDMIECARDVIPIVDRLDPKVIVVDGEFDGVFLLKRRYPNKKLALVTVNHYLEMNFGKYEEYKPLLTEAIKQADIVFVHGIEKPTVKFPNAMFVGPLISPVEITGSDPNRVAIVMSPSTDKEVLDFAKRLGMRLSKGGYDVDLLGRMESGWKLAENTLEYLKHASLVISSGGLTILGEAYGLGRQSLVLHDNNDEEKRRNALAIQRLGYGKALDVGKVDIDNAFENAKKLIRNQKGMAQHSTGTSQAVKVIVKLLS